MTRKFGQDVALRITTAQREFLERYAGEHNVGICAAVRVSIDEMMKNEGVTS